MKGGRLLATVVMVLASCAGPGNAGVRSAETSGTSSATIPPAASAVRTARPTTAASGDCTVSWADNFQSIDLMAQNSELIVRAVAIGQGIVQLRAFGARDSVFPREARYTTLRVLEVVKDERRAASTELHVVEDVCPNLTLAPGEEWVLFARRLTPRYGPADGRAYYATSGGPQGQFRLRDGRVVGPFYGFAQVVHSYEGASVDDVLADARAARPLDMSAAEALIERYGWTIVTGTGIADETWPTDLGADRSGRPFDAFARASRSIGLDVGPYAGQTLRRAGFMLEYDRPSTEKQYVATAWFGASGRIVGAWMTVAHDVGDSEVFALSERDAALASRGRR